jgi:hypothetical protein
MKHITIFALFAALLTIGPATAFAADTQPTEEPVEQISHAAVNTSPAAPVNVNWLSINGGGISYGAGGTRRVGYSIGQSLADREGAGGGIKVGLGFWYGSKRVCGADKGDMNGVGGLSSADVVLMLNCVFLANGAGTLGGDCNLCYADMNCVGGLTSADVVIELNYVFLGTPPPCI